MYNLTMLPDYRSQWTDFSPFLTYTGGMNTSPSGLTYRELARLAETLFEESGDDEEALAGLLDGLDRGILTDLLVSDLFNAYQTFFYFFREEPGDLEKDRMILQPASALIMGIVVREVDLLEIIFMVRDMEPVVEVREADAILATFSGKTAFHDAEKFVEDYL